MAFFIMLFVNDPFPAGISQTLRADVFLVSTLYLFQKAIFSICFLQVHF